MDGLEGNFVNIVKDCLTKRIKGKDPKDFLLQCSLKTSYDTEVMKIDFGPYLEDVSSTKESSDEKSGSLGIDNENDNRKEMQAQQ